MKLQTYIILILVLTINILSSCREKDLPPTILVNPEGIYIESGPAQLFEFGIEAFSANTELRNILISIKPEVGATTTLLDTAVYGKKVNFYFIKEILSTYDNAVITFKVYDTDGEQGSTAKRIIITGEEDIVLTESQGFDLYSHHSLGNFNAFNISENQNLQLSVSPDSSIVDLVEYDTDMDNELSNILTSWSGIEFVRNNAFNYPEATAESAEASYSSSSPSQLISEVEIGDLLITKYAINPDKYAVIKITGINSNGDDETNHYTFNIKR